MDISKVTGGMRKVLPLKYCGAVIVAAGTASRMGGIDKVMAELDGEPMILRTVRTFQNCDAIKEIVVVTREDLILPIMRLCAGFDKAQVLSPRQEDPLEKGMVIHSSILAWRIQWTEEPGGLQSMRSQSQT